MDLDNFISKQNMARYRALLDTSTDETKRRAIIKLLSEEYAKLKKPRGRSTLALYIDRFNDANMAGDAARIDVSARRALTIICSQAGKTYGDASRCAKHRSHRDAGNRSI